MMRPGGLPETLPFLPRYLFTDVDDTLTWQGRLPAETYSAMENLQQAGVKIIPVTGACSGWCDCMIRTWPIAAVIGENGAFWIQKDQQGRLQQRFRLPFSERSQNRSQLEQLIENIARELPQARLTQDHPYRLTDIAYDIGQDERLANSDLDRLLALIRLSPASVRVSSIHVNIWMGAYDKASSALAWLEQEQHLSHEKALAQSIFIGDSPNDANMFSVFPHTVGVANIQRFLTTLNPPPRYITFNPGGYGFVELADTVLRSL
ncbi:HAD-IIB family hydrolase [Pokkaliibacter sp. MBI-7]|uniref:HAD-IIB family hydrolase n=1 Tax=Pokkaliibacter sp. MBI-7 TaxID=3040600 RepID=UPI00244AE7C6|nr:HAD-IIB family hydrolase [Pokkaliibacter sp. MBI-7]MDH2436062.1 HAD-IIB family hydrolase [Pokkaliibacter sp. MBI-7]